MKIPFSDMLPVGVCRFSDISENLIECRAKTRIPENAESVIVYLFPYYLGKAAYEKANISKYAVSKDYHIVVAEYLEKAVNELRLQNPGYKFRWFCDNSPVPEVQAAVFAGLGIKGENGLLINKTYGSFVFVGEIVTDMVLPPSEKNTGSCLACGVCKSKCPGGALKGDFQKEKCLSHLTQKKGELTENVANLMKHNGCIWGCDICQDSCPMNENPAVTPIKEFVETARNIYSIGDSIDDRAFAWRGREVIERNLKIMCCNDDSNEL